MKCERSALNCPGTEAWKSLTDKVQEARSNAQLKKLSFEGEATIFTACKQICCWLRMPFTCGTVFSALAGVNGLRMLGIVHEAVVFLLEQLYGSRHCQSYCFRFHKPEEGDEPPINPHGSARAEINHR